MENELYENTTFSDEELQKMWYVQVKDVGSGSTIIQDIIYNADNKKDVRKQLLILYPDYFEDETYIRERITGKTPTLVSRYLTTIFPLTKYWANHWLEIKKCKQCGKEYTRIEFNKYLRESDFMSYNFCSKECLDKYEDYRRSDYYVSPYSEYDAYIYKITHKETGKFYIGVTTQWLMSRWWQHIKASTNSKFHQFVKEHNLNEFTFEVLESFNPREIDPYELEDKYIKQYDAVNSELGLNSTKRKMYMNVD